MFPLQNTTTCAAIEDISIVIRGNLAKGQAVIKSESQRIALCSRGTTCLESSPASAAHCHTLHKQKEAQSVPYFILKELK